jgi:hypothetical protein
LFKWIAHGDDFAGARYYEFPKAPPLLLLVGPADLTLPENMTMNAKSLETIS